MAKKFNQRLRDLDKAKTQTRPAPPPPGFGRRTLDDEPPLELAGLILFGLIGTVILAGLATVFGLRNIEADLSRRTERLLVARGAPDLTVDVDGLDVSIVGTVERDPCAELPEDGEEVEPPLAIDPDALESCITGLVGRLEGIGTVNANVIYERPVDPRDIAATSEGLLVTWQGRTATATGTLSSQASVDAFVAAAEDAFPGIDVAGLTVKEGIASERDWLSPIMRLMAELGGELPEGEIIVNPDAGLVKVSAEFETRQEQRDIKDDVEEILAGVTLDFSSGLTVKDAPRVTAEEVQELQENINDLIEGKVVEFEFNSAVITPLGEELLDEVLAALRQFPNVPIEIAGHTDNVGSPEANLELSEERARAVLAYLVDRGEDAARFVVTGYGEAQPVADNGTESGRARNRRIEFIAILDNDDGGEE